MPGPRSESSPWPREGAFEEKTLELRESKGSEERVDFQTGTAHPSHQFDGWTIVRQVSGDSTGEHTVTCLGIVRDNIECNGAFQLEDGDLEVEGTSEAKRTGQATNAIVGGTGAYEGATGEVEIDYEADTFKLHLLIPAVSRTVRQRSAPFAIIGGCRNPPSSCAA